MPVQRKPQHKTPPRSDAVTSESCCGASQKGRLVKILLYLCLILCCIALCGGLLGNHVPITITALVGIVSTAVAIGGGQ